MFVSPMLAGIMIVMNLLFGCLVGLGMAATLKRSGLTVGVAVRTACTAGFAFLLATGLVTWAGSHELIENGRIYALGDSGQVLPFKTFLASHSLVIPITICLLASATSVVLSRGLSHRSIQRRSKDD